MILKELDPFDGRSPQDLEARIAADRMAYYLRRYFRRSTDVDVLHGLRLNCGRSVARIDHLLLHTHGLLVIERHESGDPLRVDGASQWLQRTEEGDVPIASPVTHAYIQALLLKDYLDRHVRQQGFFDGLALDAVVVVPDTCEIQWPTEGPLDEVCLRDNVFERVGLCMEQSRARSKAPGLLSGSERRTMGRFLCHAHLSASRTRSP